MEHVCFVFLFFFVRFVRKRTVNRYNCVLMGQLWSEEILQESRACHFVRYMKQSFIYYVNSASYNKMELIPLGT
jgi:hypothetical protein